MPSLTHDGLIELCRNSPGLVTALLHSERGLTLPDAARTVEEPVLQHFSNEYRADLVLAFGNRLRIIVEVQTTRDQRKRYSWPAYVSILHGKTRSHVELIVLATTRQVEAWARQPIVLSPSGFQLAPTVIGPDSLPAMDDPAAAREAPELAVLSALVHARSEKAYEVAEAALKAADRLDPKRSGVYVDLVVQALRGADRTRLEAFMASEQYEYKSDFARRYFNEGRAEGEARGRAEGVLAVLGKRDLKPTAEQLARIQRTTDLPMLERWLARAFEVEAVDDLFD